MARNSLKKIAVFVLVNSILIGSAVNVKAADAGSSTTDVTVEFESGVIQNPDQGSPNGIGSNRPNPSFSPVGSDSLKLVYAPHLDFGEVTISEKEKQYYAKAQAMGGPFEGEAAPYADPMPDQYVVNYMKVIDLRGMNGGWAVTVKMEEPFTAQSDTAVTKTLDRAWLSFPKSGVISTAGEADPQTVSGILGVRLDADQNEQVFMKAGQGNGAGVWYQEFGTRSDLLSANADGKIFSNHAGFAVQFNPNIRLVIPAEVMPDAVPYSATLRWTISDIPL